MLAGRASPARPPSRIAIGYHGHYRRVGARFATAVSTSWWCSDIFMTEANHLEFIYDNLRAANVTVSTYFHTFSVTQCKRLDAILVQHLQPVAYEFTRNVDASPRMADSAIRVLQLILRHEKDLDSGGAGARTTFGTVGVLLVRFDAVYQRRLLSLPIDWRAVNVAFKSSNATADTGTSDLFYALPIGLGLPLISAFAYSASREGAAQGTAHWVYDELVAHVGPRRFSLIEPLHGTSNIEAPNFDGHFLSICRSCAWIAAVRRPRRTLTPYRAMHSAPAPPMRRIQPTGGSSDIVAAGPIERFGCCTPTRSGAAARRGPWNDSTGERHAQADDVDRRRVKCKKYTHALALHTVCARRESSATNE